MNTVNFNFDGSLEDLVSFLNSTFAPGMNVKIEAGSVYKDTLTPFEKALQAQCENAYPRLHGSELLKTVREKAAEISKLAPENKIQAIKLTREVTGMGLKEAKDFVEKWLGNQYPMRP